MNKNELSQVVAGTYNGIGFCGFLGLIFITLKLTNQIDWAWVWVLAPLWGPWVAVATTALFGLMLCGAILLGGDFYTWARCALRKRKRYGKKI